MTSTYNQNKSNLSILNKKFKRKIKIQKFNIYKMNLKPNFFKKYDYIIYMISPKYFFLKRKFGVKNYLKNFISIMLNCL